MALSTVYGMLHRHGWRKSALDKQHPESDPVAQEEWKKLPETINQASGHLDRPAPLRLMFQDEARFGRTRKRDTAGVQSLFAHSRKRW
jgi:hypothetical protein